MRLFEQIRELIRQERYLIGEHASERLEERGILEWQAVEGVDDAELISERPDSLPNPSVELRQFLPDGTAYKAVWSLLGRSNAAKLVTVHFFDRSRP